MNIGAIMMRKNDLNGAFHCFYAASINQERALHTSFYAEEEAS